MKSLSTRTLPLVSALILGLSAPISSSMAIETHTLEPVVVIATPEKEEKAAAPATTGTATAATTTTEATIGSEADPLEGYNRGMHAFNEGLDQNILRPVAEGYRDIMPDPAERGVSNFFSNLREPFNILNNLLQFKFEEAVSDTVRFGLNTTVGILGFFDVASESGIPKHDEDFGQTLAVWGVESGPYFVLPLLGPSTIRDTTGTLTEFWVGNTVEVGNTQLFNPTGEITPASAENATILTKTVSKRADLLEEKAMVDNASFDPYAFMRDSWLQRRESQIHDGNVPLPALPEDL